MWITLFSLIFTAKSVLEKSVDNCAALPKLIHFIHICPSARRFIHTKSRQNTQLAVGKTKTLGALPPTPLKTLGTLSPNPRKGFHPLTPLCRSIRSCGGNETGRACRFWISLPFLYRKRMQMRLPNGFQGRNSLGRVRDGVPRLRGGGAEPHGLRSFLRLLDLLLQLHDGLL